MKKIFIIILYVACFTGVLSCDDFLQENPRTSLSSVAVLGDDASAWATLNGAYATIAGYDYYAMLFWEAHNLNSTEYTTAINNANYPTLLAGFTSGPTLGTYKSIYTISYKAINAVNVILESLPSSSGVSKEMADDITGNCYILRAMLYFNLVREFGGIPLIKKSISSLDQAHSPRAAESDVYSSIIEDLENAFEYLPEAGKNKVGYPNKWAAKALLSKVYLTMAGSGNNADYWQKCYDAAKEVYDSKAYSLVPSFADLWDPAKENSVESIMEFQLSEDTDGRLMCTNLPQDINLIPKAVFNSMNARIRLMPEMYDDFVARYPGDPRFIFSVLHTETTRITGNTGVTAVQKVYPEVGGWSNFPFCKKFIDVNSVGTKGANNFVYLRYADILLILSEAANELGTGDELTYVNEVLARARDANGNGISDAGEVEPAAWTAMSKEDFRSAIMQERRFELMGEGHSWFDERRRGEEWLKACFEHHNAHPYVTSLAGKPGIFRFPTDDDNLKKLMRWPIPSDEITANQGIRQEDQNFGW